MKRKKRRKTEEENEDPRKQEKETLGMGVLLGRGSKGRRGYSRSNLKLFGHQMRSA